MSLSSQRSLFERVLRWLVGLYPQAFRQRFEGDFVDLALMERAKVESERGSLYATLSALRTIGATAFEVVRERLRTWLGFGKHLQRRATGNPNSRRRTSTFDAFLIEGRHALRALRRSPGFALTVIVTLGLGIGANTAMFEIVDQLLLRPHPYLSAPESTHTLYYEATPEGRQRRLNGSFSYPALRAVMEQGEAFDVVAAQAWRGQIANVGGQPRKLMVMGVTGSYWSLFNMSPVVGRFFGPEEDKLPVGEAVAVLSHAYWQSEFGGDRGVVGRTVEVAGKGYSVIGVAPPRFRGAQMRPPQLFVPLTAAAPTFIGGEFASRAGTTWLTLFVRTKAGQEDAGRTAVANAITAHMAERRGADAAQAMNIETSYQPLQAGRGPYPENATRFTLWLLGMSVVLVLIATANVATLMTGRALQRHKETAVRAALGLAGLRVLVRPLLESVTLALLAGVVAIPIGRSAVVAVARSLFPQTSSAFAGLDIRSVAYGSGLILLVSLVAAVIPALQVRHSNLNSVLKSGGPQGGQRRSRSYRLLPAVQAALSALLLVAAGLFVRSVGQAASLELGYDADRVVLVSPESSGAFDAFRPGEELGFSMEELARAAEGVTGVEGVALASAVPFLMNSTTSLILPGGLPAATGPPPANAPNSSTSASAGGSDYSQSAVTPGYFRTMGTPIMRGRAFEPGDVDSGTPVMVVSESLASLVWPGRSPVGLCAHVGSDTLPCVQVVGVSADITRGDIRADGRLQLYLPKGQVHRSGLRGTLVVRMSTTNEAALRTLRSTLQSLVPLTVLIDPQPLNVLVAEQLREWTVGARVFSLFGALALMMAVVGLFSVVARDVTQRTHEFGVRAAFGAQSADLVQLVLGKGLVTIAWGILVGLLLAVWLSARLEGQLFDVSTRDPITYVAVAVVLLISAVAASFYPAVRAGRVDPQTVLRTE